MHDSMEQLKKEMESCVKCRLCTTRKNVVPGRGSDKPRIMFVGEAPGRTEDKRGIPFVGEAGNLFGRWTEELGLGPEDYYVTNVVKCFPSVSGKTRPPAAEEIKECRTWIEEEIRICDPTYIVAMGRVAMQFFFPDKNRVTAEEGMCYCWDNKKVFVILHPAYFIRNPTFRWEGMIEKLKKKLI